MKHPKIPQIRIEDKPCGCQFWKSGVDGNYSRIKTCSNYPKCKGKLFEKARLITAGENYLQFAITPKYGVEVANNFRKQRMELLE